MVWETKVTPCWTISLECVQFSFTMCVMATTPITGLYNIANPVLKKKACTFRIYTDLNDDDSILLRITCISLAKSRTEACSSRVPIKELC